MILTDQEIKKGLAQGSIVIEPFDEMALGSNSYDVHLGKTLSVYEDAQLDAKKHNQTRSFEIPPEGFVLMPGELYLGVTKEYTESHEHVPFLEGKSSIGRLGIDIHATAGKGDIGFCNYWTLEISVIKPVRVYEGMPVGQLIFFTASGKLITPYALKQNAKYTEKKPVPMESMMWKNFLS